jgi:protein-L-isoaspartate(D-aspartate) O-methyltransferase
MRNYQAYRQKMVDCQLRTNGIVDEKILKVFDELPRELFLPEKYQSAAYIDEDIILDDGCFFMEPMVFAKMLQESGVKPSDVVLNIGDDTGYSSAILSYLVSTVVTVETKIGSLDKARKIWADRDLCNIAVVKGSCKNGCPEHGPYSLIIINGALQSVPKELLEQVSDKGRIISIQKEKVNGPGVMVLYERNLAGDFSYKALCDVSTPFLQEFEPLETFKF